MNPYQPPETLLEPLPQFPGRRCPACGSTETGSSVLSTNRPGLMSVILFGWLAMLIRAAFAIQTDLCRDCGKTNRYKTTGSWVALAFLILIVLALVAELFGVLEE